MSNIGIVTCYAYHSQGKYTHPHTFSFTSHRRKQIHAQAHKHIHSYPHIHAPISTHQHRHKAVRCFVLVCVYVSVLSISASFCFLVACMLSMITAKLTFFKNLQEYGNTFIHLTYILDNMATHRPFHICPTMLS